MQAYFHSPVMQVYSELVHEQVVDHLDFQTFSDVACAGLRQRTG